MPTFVRCVPSSVTSTGGSVTVSDNGEITVTSASAITVQDVFTASRTSYRMLVSGSVSSGLATSAYIDLANGGVRANSASAQYLSGYIYLAGTSETANFANSASGVPVTWSASAGNLSGDLIMISNPANAAATGYRSVNAYGSAPPQINDYVSAHLTASAYDGFVLEWRGREWTGLVQVYAYEES